MHQRIFTMGIQNLHNLLHTMFHRSRDTVIGIATRLRAGRSGICVPAGARYFSLQKTIPAVGPNQPPIHWVHSWRSCSRSVMLKTDLHLAAGFMSGAIPLLPLYASVAWAVEALPSIVLW
jgi:hypothetical protein